MMDYGEFAQAARLFDRLAVGARRRGMPIRAANLALRAAQAHLAQGDIDPALDRVRGAIRALALHGQTQRVARLVPRINDELRERGHDAHAVELAQFAESVLGETGRSLDDLPASRSAGAPEARGSLPRRCAGCGAPLFPEDVIWHDAQTAECPYCGAVIKATSHLPNLPADRAAKL
jgi:hypothetical protein